MKNKSPNRDSSDSTDTPRFSKDFQLQTERCILRHVSESDFPHVYSATRTPGFNDGMQWEPPNDLDELREPYQRNCEAWKDGSAYVFTIVSTEGSFIGRTGIRATETPHLWNIGFWTHPEHQGQGYMTEVVKRVIAFGFEELSAKEIEASHASWNEASKRVLEKCGMTWREHIEKGFQKRGKWIPEERLSITDASKQRVK